MEPEFDFQQAQVTLFCSTLSRHIGAHTVTHSMGTMDSSLGVQWSETTCKFQGQKCMAMYLHSPVHLCAMVLA
jgi:hypothetical protein